jgi:transcriptional regulator with XRE-family HTH domain
MDKKQSSKEPKEKDLSLFDTKRDSLDSPIEGGLTTEYPLTTKKKGPVKESKQGGFDLSTEPFLETFLEEKEDQNQEFLFDSLDKSSLSLDFLDFSESSKTLEEKNSSKKQESFSRAKTSLRMLYEAKAQIIRKQLGGLKGIQKQLSLSQRKLAQLLMVDPSTWNRWSKQEDSIPPHIWRSLEWYLALQDQVPGLSPTHFTGLSLDQINVRFETLSNSLQDSIEESQKQGYEKFLKEIQESLAVESSVKDSLSKLEEKLESSQKKILLLMGTLFGFTICFLFLTIWIVKF